MDWLKDKPGLAWILNLLSTVLIVFLTFWLTGWGDSRNAVSESIRALQNEKTPYSYVDNQDSKLKSEIDNKADKSLVESMDKKLDLILLKLN